MNFYEGCIATYDCYIATNREPLQEGVPWRPMAPVGHTAVTPDVEIAVSVDGTFLGARVPDKKCPDMAVIPVTEESRGRAGSAARPHCLSDKSDYILPDGKNHGEYMKKLRAWDESEYTHPSVTAVRKYLEGGSIVNDLMDKGVYGSVKSGIIYLMVCGGDGKGLNDDGTVNWRDVSARYDETLIQCHIDRYLNSISGKEKVICELTGEKTVPAENNLPKGVVRINGNAKLMSVNDNEFTFLGENFVSGENALSVGYVESQKLHQALQWEFAHGMLIGTRAFAVWNIEREGRILRISAVADAATTGRLAITYYNIRELRESEERDADAWSLSVEDIPCRTLADLAYGTPVGIKDKQRVEASDELRRNAVQALMMYIDGRGDFPLGLTRAMISKAGNLSVYSRKNRGLLLKAVCMCIRLTKGWETDETSRDYRYGELFAILEYIESSAYPGRDDSAVLAVQREFNGRPRRAFEKMYRRLKECAYPIFAKSDRDLRNYCDGLIAERYTEDMGDSPINGNCLIGYRNMRQNLWAPKGSVVQA